LKRVLVVEDDEVYREALVRALGRAGYSVTSASSVADLGAVTDHGPPDLALIDLRLGDESGIDAVHLLAREAPRCRVLMLSGHGTIRSAVEAMRAGAVDFLTKPVSSAEILRALQEAAEVALPSAGAASSLDAVEREHILRTLEAADGNVSEAARRLGLHRRTLQRKLQKLP
jgi:two-component system response regulator RegA